MTNTNAYEKNMPALVQFSAMVFGVVVADSALQSMADAFDVSTIAIGRIDKVTGVARVLAQNSSGIDVRAGWSTIEDSAQDHHIALAERNITDIMIFQSSVMPILKDQRAALDDIAPFLVAFWGARKASFDIAMDQVRIELTESMLHPDNPYNLTRTELRISFLITRGQRPKEMALTMNTSMATIRTHLRHIYAKTGLDGMFGVQNHLQSFSETKGGAQ